MGEAVKVEVDPTTYLDAEEAARRLNYSIVHFYRLCRSGKIRAMKLGRTWFITPEEVERVKSLQDEHGRLTT